MGGTKDDRDLRTWVVYELTPSGEEIAHTGALEKHLRSLLKAPALDVFVPYVSYTYESRVALFNVMEGYCFVSTGLDERSYFSISHDSPYLRKVLHTKCGGSNVLMTVPESSVQSLRDKLSHMVAEEIKEGMQVKVSRGVCQGLTGQVLSLESDTASVLIQMRTLNTIRTIPRFALIPVEDEHE